MARHLAQVCAAASRASTPTAEWLDELKASFHTRAAAQEQCARDWPRMNVLDGRSSFHLLWDYMWGNELLDYFGNQSTMARVFDLAMKATRALPGDPHSELFLVQCSHTPFELAIHPSGGQALFTLRKRFLIKRVTSSGATSTHATLPRLQTRLRTRLRTLDEADEADENPKLVGTLESIVHIGSDTSSILFLPVPATAMSANAVSANAVSANAVSKE